MRIFENVVLSGVEAPVVVHSEVGRKHQTENRPCYGLSLCTGGQITYTMNGKNYISVPGSAVLLLKGADYTLYGDREGIFPVVNFQCENLDCRDITVLPLQDPDHCLRLFEELAHLFLHGESRLHIFSTMYRFLEAVSREDRKGADPLQPAIEYIREHLGEPSLTNEVLAKHMGISEVYLRKLFAAHLHTSPKQYIMEARLRKAGQLLVDTPFSVTAIAEECGFSSLYYFCRAFKQKTGLSPTEYARANRCHKI